MNLAKLKSLPHLTVHTTQNADAILEAKFPGAVRELYKVLSRFRIEKYEVTQGGGGESSMTQRLRRALTNEDWPKKNIKEQYFVDEVEFEAESHEVDHLRVSGNGRIALEIEWNNKDPFFDRDLENYRKLHQIGYISVGAIITRGAKLQASLVDIFKDHYSTFPNVDSIQCTVAQKNAIGQKVQRGQSLGDAAGIVLCNSKYGKATTHWDKLMVRVNQRGLGKPCPLLLIGLESSIVI